MDYWFGDQPPVLSLKISGINPLQFSLEAFLLDLIDQRMLSWCRISTGHFLLLDFLLGGKSSHKLLQCSSQGLHRGFLGWNDPLLLYSQDLLISPSTRRTRGGICSCRQGESDSEQKQREPTHPRGHPRTFQICND